MCTILHIIQMSRFVIGLTVGRVLLAGNPPQFLRPVAAHPLTWLAILNLKGHYHDKRNQYKIKDNCQ
jgi:hypothetical protein